MNILWITPQFPCKRTGAQVRQFQLLKHLSQKNTVTIISLIQKTETDAISDLTELGIAVITDVFEPSEIYGLWRNRLRSWAQIFFDPLPNYANTYPVKFLQEQLSIFMDTKIPDLIHLDDLFVAPLGGKIKSLPWVLTEHNVESHNINSQTLLINTLPRRFSNWVEVNKLYKWERKMLNKCKVCIAVSDNDANLLQKIAPGLVIHVVPNGVDTTYFSPPYGVPEGRKDILFFGNLGYQPNIDGLIYFIKTIFPIIKAKAPEVELNIIGPNASFLIKEMDKIPGVNFVGFVEDLRPHLWHALVSVVPLRSGGGTRLKILEALAAGCPVVSTSIGVEGLDLIHGEDLLIADTPSEFSESVLRIINDPLYQKRLSNSVRERVRTIYDWSVIGPQLEQVFLSTINQFNLVN